MRTYGNVKCKKKDQADEQEEEETEEKEKDKDVAGMCIFQLNDMHPSVTDPVASIFSAGFREKRHH